MATALSFLCAFFAADSCLQLILKGFLLFSLAMILSCLLVKFQAHAYRQEHVEVERVLTWKTIQFLTKLI